MVEIADFTMWSRDFMLLLLKRRNVGRGTKDSALQIYLPNSTKRRVATLGNNHKSIYKGKWSEDSLIWLHSSLHCQDRLALLLHHHNLWGRSSKHGSLKSLSKAFVIPSDDIIRKLAVIQSIRTTSIPSRSKRFIKWFRKWCLRFWTLRIETVKSCYKSSSLSSS